MPLYETIFILRQDVPVAQADAMSKVFAEIIAANGGKVAKIEPWGLRNLAYKINKNKKGHYVLLAIDAPPDAITEMERNMRLSEDVLRFMTIRVEELETAPSVILRKEERTDNFLSGEKPDRSTSGRTRAVKTADVSVDSKGE
ncbi:MAG: 30S ribosomal protein S6 [Alphaproteobacteria bacterium]|nr:30S ribosomal protein S6 [Alphaproteobacteria bacterium]MCL2505141.1 30S ribosomal protein S6 [Alphaproteobacteria bacterium]